MEKINFYILCRLCLKDSHFHTNIFEDHLMNNRLVHEILNEMYDLDISVGDGLPKFVCIKCLATIKEFMLFLRKAKKGRSVLKHLKEEMEKRNSDPILLKSEILPFWIDFDTQDDVSESWSSKYTSATAAPTSSNADLIISNTIASEITNREEHLGDEVVEPRTSEYSSATVNPTSSNAEVISSEITVKIEPWEMEEFACQDSESLSKAVADIPTNAEEITDDFVPVITGEERPLQTIGNQNMQFVETKRGGRKLLYDGYAYVVDRKKDGVTRWRCEKKRGCSGRLMTISDVVQGIPIVHSHPPDSGQILALQCINKIRQEAEKSNESTSCIIRKCTSDVPLSAAWSLSKKDALAKMIRRKRAAIDVDKLREDG